MIADPFAALVEAHRATLAEMERQYTEAVELAATLKAQIARAHVALTALIGSHQPTMRGRREWTPEQRAAEGERLRRKLIGRGRKKSGSLSTPPDEEPKQELIETTHVHQWKIETPNGPTVTGTCECGQTKQYASGELAARSA